MQRALPKTVIRRARSKVIDLSSQTIDACPLNPSAVCCRWVAPSESVAQLTSDRGERGGRGETRGSFSIPDGGQMFQEGTKQKIA